VKVDQAGRAELGHPPLLWTQAVEALYKSPKEKEDNLFTECSKNPNSLL